MRLTPFAPIAAGRDRLQVHRTGHQANDAYTAYLEMGVPKDLGAQQLARLQALTQDRPEVDRVVKVGKAGTLQWTLPMRTNDIALVTLQPLGAGAARALSVRRRRGARRPARGARVSPESFVRRTN